MWPNSPFAIPTSSFNSPVPLVNVDPDTGPFITVCFNKEWQPYIVGALKQLMLQTTWATTDPNQLNLVQQRANNLINLFFRSKPLCNPETALIARAGAEGDENLIRQDPDNPCLLQTSIDGINWCTFADISLCLPANAQPSQHQPQPHPGGGCQIYHGSMGANNRWIVPTLVNTGDTVELLNPFGAGQDGVEAGGLEWRCYDGFTFIQDFCVTGTLSFSGTDPLPSAPHMSLIANIDGTFHPLIGGAITVPMGVSNAQVIVQVNDSDLTNNAGNYTFDLQICNNTAGTWCMDFNFLASPGGFAPSTAIPNPVGAWAAGVGWQFTDAEDGTSGNFVREVFIALDLGGTFTVTAANFTYTLTRGTHIVDGSQALLLGEPNHNTNYPTANGTGLIYTNTAVPGSATLIQARVNADYHNASTAVDGNAVITALHIEGTGTGPTGSVPC